jgi:Tol biopolymer transport system component
MYTSGAAASTQLTWFDRTGKKVDPARAPADLRGFSLSPDDTTVVFARRDPQAEHFDLRMQDLVQSRESRLTFREVTAFRSGQRMATHVFFLSDRDGADRVYQKAVNSDKKRQGTDSARNSECTR